MPALLSINSYADIKLFTFYVSYIGLLSLGYVDGLYIKYGGRPTDHIVKEEYKYEHNLFWKLELLVTIVVCIIAVFLDSKVWFLFGMNIIPANILGYYTSLNQAMGEFTLYSRMLVAKNLLYLILNAFFLFIIRTDNSMYYIMATIIPNAICLCIYELRFSRKNYKIKEKRPQNIINNFKVGLYIMVGNLAVISFYAIDRWFVQIFFQKADFAYYSMAVSMLSIINTVLDSIAIVFYNYLAKEKNRDFLLTLRNCIICLGGLASIGYFFIDLVVRIWIKKYIPSLSIIAISFAAYPYMLVVKIIAINLYKVYKLEKEYLLQIVIMLMIAIGLNGIAVVIYKEPEAIAFATLISFIVWFIISNIRFNLKFTGGQSICTCVLTISFLVCSHKGSFYYCLLYFIIWLTVSLILTRDIIKNYIMKKRN